MEKIVNELKSSLKSFICFIIACLLLPVLLLSFVCVHYGNALANYVLSIKYPTLTISKSKKIRTLIDTPRNAGIFHFLLHVRGPCDFDRVRQHYSEHLTDLRDKAGYLRFPKLRQKLVTCWGHYAWVNDVSSFNINNHVLLSSRTYRGRLVNDGNIQEFASDLVTKYIPSDLPQWQVIVIPTWSSTIAAEGTGESSPDDHYYILLKIHHLIVAEEDDLHISEMLMLQEHDRRHIDIDMDDLDQLAAAKAGQSNLSYFVRKPVHIEHLARHLCRLAVNRWHEFIYEFESLETPDGYRRVQITNVTQLLSVLLIVAVNVCVDYCRTMRAREKLRRRYRNYKDILGRWAIASRLMTRELEQRNLNWWVAYRALCYSWHPANIIKAAVRLVWQFLMQHVVLLPYHLYCELMALREVLFKGQTHLMHTYCGRLSVYVPMLLYAQLEFFKICYELYKAPVNIYEELFENTSKQMNILQMKSYSGRKIVSFSRPIDAAVLRQRLRFDNDVRESDFTLSCLAGALYDYFETFAPEAAVPHLLNTTCRTMSKGYFTDNLGDKSDHIGGVVFLPLPLRIPNRAHAQQMHNIVENIRRKQIMIYLASMAQTKSDLLTAVFPSVLTKIAINFFSFTFPVTLTQIHGANSEFHTVWGQQAEDVLFFRPPQSKTCLSLNIHRLGDKYRLAIMADTQLGPDHALICRSFENYMETGSL